MNFLVSSHLFQCEFLVLNTDKVCQKKNRNTFLPRKRKVSVCTQVKQMATACTSKGSSPKSGIHLLQGLHKSHLVAPQQSSPVCKHQWERSCSAIVPMLRCRKISDYMLPGLLPDLQDVGWCGRACQL